MRDNGLVIRNKGFGKGDFSPSDSIPTYNIPANGLDPVGPTDLRAFCQN